MTTLRWREKCLRNRLENGISGRCVPARRETAPFPAPPKQRGSKPAKTLPEGRLVYKAS